MAVAPVSELIATQSELAAPSGRALVVIDASVGGASGVAESFGDSAATVVVGAGDDLFASVGGTLERLGDVSAIHLVSHGSPGRFSLGGTTFDAAGIDEWDDGLVAWNRMAGPGADLYLWGCDVAGGDGASLVDAIGMVSGFGVAASTDATGPARLGGDFDLEYVFGDVAAPRLAAGVDVLWETTLSSPVISANARTALNAAFNRLETTIAPDVEAVLTSATNSGSAVPFVGRSVSSLFQTESSAITPADVAALLSVKTAAQAAMASGTQTLAGLATAIQTALEAAATSAGAASHSVTVTPTFTGTVGTPTGLRLDIAVGAERTGTAAVDLGTASVPTPIGRVFEDLSAELNMNLRSGLGVTSGTRLDYTLSVSVNLVPSTPVASISMGSIQVEGIATLGPSPVRFGVLDAQVGGTETVVGSTTVSFSNPTQTVANWSSVDASATTVEPLANSILELPITATLPDASGTPVAITSPSSKIAITAIDPTGLLPWSWSATDIEDVVWFTTISSDDIIASVKQAGAVYQSLASTDERLLGAELPFTARKTLADAFDFGSLFEQTIGTPIDVTVTVTETIVDGNGVSQNQSFQARPSNLQTFNDFAAMFTSLGIQPVYDASAGTVLLQFSSNRTDARTLPAGVAFDVAPLGGVTFAPGTSLAVDAAVEIAFGVEFEIGPAGPVVMGLGDQPSSFVLSGNASFQVIPTFGTAFTVNLASSATTGNTTIQHLVDDLNAALAGVTSQFRARVGEFNGQIELYTDPVGPSMPPAFRVVAARSAANAQLGFDDGAPDGTTGSMEFVARASGVVSRVVDHATLPLATGSFTKSLADLAGSASYGFNTVTFGDSAGSLAVQLEIDLPAPTGGAAVPTPDEIASDPEGHLVRTLTGSAALDLLDLERVGVANDIDPQAAIEIEIQDLAVGSVDAFVAFGVPLPVAKLAAGGQGRLTADTKIAFVRNSATYTVNVTQAQAANNQSFADLVADFRTSLASNTTRKVGSAAAAAFDASALFDFESAESDTRIQPLALQTIDNPEFAAVTLPPIGQFGSLSYEGQFGIATVVDALEQAAEAFDVIQTELAALAEIELPLLNRPLTDLIALDDGLARRLDALRQARVTSPAGLRQAIQGALGLDADQVAVAFDPASTAYRIDIQYEVSVATSFAIDLDLAPFYELLGEEMPEDIGVLTDGGGASPLDVLLSATSVLSVGIDLADPENPRTFLFGFDPDEADPLAAGTSFQIDFSVAGEEIDFSAGTGAFGVFIRGGTATLDEGSVVITLSGPEGTDPGEQYYLEADSGELDALDVTNYAAEFAGEVEVILPLYAPTEFIPAQTADGEDLPDAIADEPNAVYLGISDLGEYVTQTTTLAEAEDAAAALRRADSTVDADGKTLADWEADAEDAAAAIADVLEVYAPDLEESLENAQLPTLVDFLRDPALFLDGIDVLLGTIETALRGLKSLDLPLVGGALGDAVNGVFGWRRGWLLDMKHRMRGAGESVFEVARDGIYDVLGPEGLGLVLKDNGIRSVAGMIEADSAEDVTLGFVDEEGEEVTGNARGAYGVEFRMRLGQQVFDTGVDMSFTFDALAPVFELAMNGGLRFQLGWDMQIGFGFNMDDGFYVIVDGDAPEAQLRFDASLLAGSAGYRATYDVASPTDWYVVDAAGNPVRDDDGEQFVAIAVNEDGEDVTADVPDPNAPLPPTEEEECVCGDEPADEAGGEAIWWVVAAEDSGAWVPAELDEYGRFVPQGDTDVDSMIEVVAMAPATVRGSLFFLEVSATDKIRRGLTGVTDYEDLYSYDASEGPQNEADARDNEETGVNRNNELPSLFYGTIGINLEDPSAAVEGNEAVADAASISGSKLVDADGVDVLTDGAITPVRQFYAFTFGDGEMLVPCDWIDNGFEPGTYFSFEYEDETWFITPDDATVTGVQNWIVQFNNSLVRAVRDTNQNGELDPTEGNPNGPIANQPVNLAAEVTFDIDREYNEDTGRSEAAKTWYVIAPPEPDPAAGPADPNAPDPTLDEYVPVHPINADPSENKITFAELRAGGIDLVTVDFVATAVVNLEMRLSIGGSAKIPSILADLNVDWSTDAAREATAPATPPAEPDPDAPEGIDPNAPGAMEMDMLPEIGLSNIRLDLGSYLTKFVKPIVDEIAPYIGPDSTLGKVVDFLQERVPVISDIAKKNIRVIDLVKRFGGPKGESLATLVDAIASFQEVIGIVGDIDPGVNLAIPLGRFWMPKQTDEATGEYTYGEMLYDNEALGINVADTADAETQEALDALETLKERNPENDDYDQPGVGREDRGGFRMPILEDPLVAFQMLMGQDATLFTYTLPKISANIEVDIPLLKIVCFEVGLRFGFDFDTKLSFGYDTFGYNLFAESGDILDLVEGFYVSDTENADGSGADTPELQTEIRMGLYGGINVLVAKGGIEGGLSLQAELDLNDPNNDGKLRLTEAVGLVLDTGNPLDLFDLTLRGEVYARYYYSAFGIKGGKKFATQELFDETWEGSDGTPIFGEVITARDDAGNSLPGTLVLNVGENAAKRVSNQDPLGAKDGAEQFRITNSGSTVTVTYLNYGSDTRSFTGVQRVVFAGGVGDDWLDASGLNGIPLEFYGGDGDDRVELGSGHASTESILDGGDGNDRVAVSGGGKIFIAGDLGDDTIVGGTGIVVIDAGGGSDTVSTAAGSTSSLLYAGQFGEDDVSLSASALQNLLDFTDSTSPIFANLVSGTDNRVEAGTTNIVRFNLLGATEIRGSQQRDTFQVVNPGTRSANAGSGLILRGGLGNDIYDVTIDDASLIGGDGITIDDVLDVVEAEAGDVELCGECNMIESIEVDVGGSGYVTAPDVVIVDETGYGARAVATIDENGTVTAITVTRGGRDYTNPQVFLVNPRSTSDRLSFQSQLTAATLARSGTTYSLAVGGKNLKWIGYDDVGQARPEGFDASEVDSVSILLPLGVLTQASSIDLFENFEVVASRMVQNARIVADTVSITTDHGFQVKHAIDTTNNGDITLRVTGDGDLNDESNLATAAPVVVGGAIQSLTILTGGNHYHFDPSITIAGGGGWGARFAAQRTGDSLSGFTQLAGGSGYFQAPAPIVIVPPPASIQVDAMVTSSTVGSLAGLGDGRGRVMLYADTGAVATSGEVFFPADVRPGTPQGSRTIDWIDGDFRYRASVGLDDIVDAAMYPGISVGTGAEFEAELDEEGQVVGFTRISGGSGYDPLLPPAVAIEGLATATAVVGSDGSIESLRITYPGEGYGQPPLVTIRPNGFGRVVVSPNGQSHTAAGDVLMNRVHIRAIGGTLVAVGGAGVGDPLKPLKSDVETFVAQVTMRDDRGIHLLEKDGLRIGQSSGLYGLGTIGGDVTITTFTDAIELGAPKQMMDAEGRLLWQDEAETIPIYERDPFTGEIVYEGGEIAVGSGSVKLTADDIEVNVDLNGAGGGATLVLQPVRVDAEIGLAGTRARVEAVVENGELTGFNPDSLWGGRGYTAAPLVVVDPAGHRAFARAVVTDGSVTAIELVYGGTNYSPDDPPVVTLTGGLSSGGTPSNAAEIEAIIGPDGSITGFEIVNAGGGYAVAPTVAITSPGQALVQAVLDLANPDPVTRRYSVLEFVVVNPGRNYTTPPKIEVAAPYDFTLDADEIEMFDNGFETVVIGRIEGQHVFHSPQASFSDGVQLRAPRAGGTLDVASFSASGPVSIVGSGNTFHFDGTSPILTGTSISIDDNVIVHAGVSGVATATTGGITIFGTGKGMIDGDPTDNDNDAIDGNEDLLLTARTNVLVTGAVGSRWKLDDLTVRSGDYVATPQVRDSVVFEQSAGLTGNLTITGAAVTIGGVVDVDGDLVIDASSMVAFAADVTVGGNLVITGASGVTFSGGLSVGGTIMIVGTTGTVRFEGLVTTTDDLAVTTATSVEFLAGLSAAGDVTLTANEVEFRGGVASVTGPATGTLVVKPFTASRPIRVGTPTGTNAGTLDISDTDLAAIAPGWAGVVIGDVAAGTGAVTIGSIGTQQGSKNSWIGNTTTIVGGSVTVAQKVDVAATAGYLQLVGRTGGITVNAAINETAAERNAWLVLDAAQAISLKAPIWASQTVSLISGTTAGQTAVAPIQTAGLRVSAGGAVSLGSLGNAFDTLAVATTNDDILVSELTGYAIGTVDGVSGIKVGTATATLVSSGAVSQSQPIAAGTLDLQGAGGEWTLGAANTIGTLTADTGRLTVVDAGALTVGRVTASKQDVTAIDLYAPGGLTLTGPITTTGGHVTLNDAVTLAADIVIDVEDAGAIGRVNFMATIEGTTAGQQSLGITGHLFSNGSLGSAIALESLSVSGDSTLGRNGSGALVRTVGGQTFSGQTDSDGTVTVQAGVGSTVRFLGNVSLGGLVTAIADTAAYDVLVTGSTVAITNPVTFTNTGSVTLGDAATDDLHFVGGVSTAAASATNLAGTIRTTDSAATFGRTSPNAGVVLAGDTTVSTGSGAALFAGTVDGPHRLVVNAAGDTTFAAAVGGTTPLAHVETDAAGRTLVNGGSVTTAGPASQLFADPVILGADTVFTAGNAAAVTFGSTLDGAFTVAVNTTGTTRFGGAVGGTTPLASLTTDVGGTTEINGGSVATSGVAGQVFNDAVILGAGTVLDAAAGAITFATTLDGAFALAANTTGTTRFGGAVGGTTPLVSLSTNAGGTTEINGGGIATSGLAGQVFNDAGLLGAGTVLDAAAGAITFATTLDGAFALAANTTGTTRFGGAVGGVTPLASLTTDAGGTTEINGGAVTTSGAAGQVYSDAVTLGANTVLDAAAGAITFATTLDGAFALAANTTGTTTFGGAVGGVTPLVSLVTDVGGTTQINGGSIATSGIAGQVFNDAVTLGANTVLSAATGAITFATTLDGAHTLAVDTTGTTTFGGAVGGTTPLVSLATNAGGTTEINGGAVTTSGAAGQVYSDAVTLGANTVLDADAGAITFATTLDGAHTLAVDTTGTTTFGGAVGGTSRLVSLTTNAGGTTAITGGSIKTSGANGQVFNDAVALGANATLDADAGAITFATTLDGAHALAVDTTGTTTFGGAVGGGTPLVSLATNAGGTTAINGGSVTTGGSDGQSYGDAVTLGADTTLTAQASGAVLFAGTVDGGHRFVVNTAGDTTFAAAVGGTTPLVRLLTDAPGRTILSGGSVVTSGPAGQRYDDPVVLAADTTLTAQNGRDIRFGATVDGGFALVANTNGTTEFGGAVGGTTPLVSLATDAGGMTRLAGGAITTTGAAGQVFADAVVLGADATLAAGAGVIAFGGTLDGAFALIADTTGLTAFGAAVGDNVPLASLATSAGGVSAIGGGRVRTIGDQAWRDDVVGLSGDTMFRSSTGAIVAGTDTIFMAVDCDVDFVAGSGIGASVAPMAPPAAAIRIAAASVTARVTGSGDINIVGLRDLVIGSAGLTAPGTITIDASSGQIRVPDGGWIAAGGDVTAGKPVQWSVLGTADAGPGSLRQVISNANISGVEGVVVFTGASNVFRLGSDLTAVTTRLTIDGTGAGVVLDGGRTATDGLSFWGPGSAGSTLRAVTLRNFNGAGVVLDASAGTLVQGIVVQASGTGLRAAGNLAGASLVGSTFTGNSGFGIQLAGASGFLVDGNSVTSLNTATSMGFFASGESAGTRVVGNVFRGGLRGALLDGAKRLVFGEIGRGNRLIGSAPVSGSDFAGTGIRAQGDLAGTTIRSNVITGNNYGMAFVNARGVTFGGRQAAERNRINTSKITGVLVVGDNTGSTQVGTVFGVGANRNRVNITRARGSRGA